MTLNIRNIVVVLLTVATALFIVIGAANGSVAADCKYRYYSVSLSHVDGYDDEKIRVMDMRIFDAYIYDLPKLPSSWVYEISNNYAPDGRVAFMYAAAKSDNHTIEYKDLENFLVLRQPNNKAEEEKIYMRLIILHIGKKGGTSIDIEEADDNAFTVKRIDKCLPEKPARH
ncbi:MAG: hypothetical protein L7F77_14135 [Candidatus Magnetominusculus sp. LBB02]|nr:hypothetical protein [Candidatus Magnetominusculus sp. LBB02]